MGGTLPKVGPGCRLHPATSCRETEERHSLVLVLCQCRRNCSYKADLGHDHSYMPGWSDASERWDVSVSDHAEQRKLKDHSKVKWPPNPARVNLSRTSGTQLQSAQCRCTRVWQPIQSVISRRFSLSPLR